MSDPVTAAAGAWTIKRVAGALWAARFPIVVILAAIAIGGLVLWADVLDSRLQAAKAEAREADARARVNAETVARLERVQVETLAAIARDAQAARERTERTARTVETLRRDPSHAAAAAPVLGRAVDRLRERRGAGGADPAPAAAGVPAGAGAAPASP